MSSAAVLLLLMTSCQSEPGFELTEEVGPYTVSLIEKNIWHVEDCNSSNPAGSTIKSDGTQNFNNCSDMYIVRGKNRAVLIDLSNDIKWADSADVALRKIFYDRAGKRQKSITITHNHGDHTGMLYAFKNENDVDFLLPKKDFENNDIFPKDRTELVEDLSLINLGGDMTLECVEVAGHTPGSTVFFVKGHDKAFSGDAIGSGNGVWLFTADAFIQYEKGLSRLASYIDDPSNGVDKDKLTFYGGHYWQKGKTEKLGIQYLNDMQTLAKQIIEGKATWEPYNASFKFLNANYKYGTAIITWNQEAGAVYGNK